MPAVVRPGDVAEKLKQMFVDDCSADDMAKATGLSVSSVYMYCAANGMRFRERKKANAAGEIAVDKEDLSAVIPCLNCRDEFLSSDKKRNRICSNCKRENSWFSGVMYG